MTYLPAPPPVDEDLLFRTSGDRPRCQETMGCGYDGDIYCDLVSEHPGEWHYENDGIWWRNDRP